MASRKTGTPIKGHEKAVVTQPATKGQTPQPIIRPKKS
jgi:hypothetical protein